MGTGVAFGNQKAKVAPDELEAPLDLKTLVYFDETRFPSSPSKPPKVSTSPRALPSAAYECLLFLQDVRHTKGRLSVQAHVTLDDPGQSPKPPPLPGAGRLPSPPHHEEVGFPAELSDAANDEPTKAAADGSDAESKIRDTNVKENGRKVEGSEAADSDHASKQAEAATVEEPSDVQRNIDVENKVKDTRQSPDLLDESEPDQQIVDLVDDESRQATKEVGAEQSAPAAPAAAAGTSAEAPIQKPPAPEPGATAAPDPPDLQAEAPAAIVSASALSGANIAATATTATTVTTATNTTNTTATGPVGQATGAKQLRLPLDGHAHLGPPQALPHDVSASLFSDDGSPVSEGGASPTADEAALAATASGGTAWLTRQCLGKCTWKSAKSLQVPYSDRASYTLHLRVFDRRKMIAKLEEPLAELPTHQPLQRDLAIQTTTSTTSFYRSRKFDKNAKEEPERRSLKLSFQLLNAEAFARRRVVYIVRHAESIWNAAQHNRQLYTMMSDTDHGLSQEGGLQAIQLSERLLAAIKDPLKSPDVQEMLQPNAVFVSPMCRAVQTAVMALGAALLQKGLGKFTLLPNAREKQSLGGMDSISTKSGLAILEAVRSKLDDLLRTHENVHRDVDQVFRKLKFDISATQEQWWHDGKSERQASVALRLQEFMSQLLYSPHDCTIVVGHSLFFKALVKTYLSKEFIQHSPEFAKQIANSKLQNCGIMRLELDSSRGMQGKPIVDARMVLGTKLITSKKK